MVQTSQVFLFTGYSPDYRKAVNDKAYENSSGPPDGPDILRLGPKLRMETMEDGRFFLGNLPVSEQSKGRTLILNMEGCRPDVQTHLLILIENPPASSRIILHCPNRMGLLSTIVSRCVRRDFPTPTYAEILVDLTRGGRMDFEPAAATAKKMERGHQEGVVSDPSALSAAEGLIEAARLGDFDLGIRYIQQFTPAAVAALRERLIVKAPEKVNTAYGPYDPQGIALRVFRSLLVAKRP